MKTETEARAVLDQVTGLTECPGPIWPGLTYEDGVRKTLEWMLDDKDRNPLQPSKPALEEPVVLDMQYALPPGWQDSLMSLAERPGWEIKPVTEIDWLPPFVSNVMRFAVRDAVGFPVTMPDIELVMWARINVMRDKGAIFGYHTDGYSLYPEAVSAVLFANDVAEEDGGGLTFSGLETTHVQPKAGHMVVFHGAVLAHKVDMLRRDDAVRVAVGTCFLPQE